MHIYNWLNYYKGKHKNSTLPIYINKTNKVFLDKPLINALGGPNNIESYRPIPNSRRIRVTLINPNLIDKNSLKQIDMQLFMRIGKKIVHIIP